MQSKLFTKIIDVDMINMEQKKSLLAIKLKDMEEIDVKVFLKKLGLSRYLSLFDGKRPKFEITDSNEILLAAFKGRGWITRYEKDKDDSNCYRAYGRIKKKQYELPTQLL